MARKAIVIVPSEEEYKARVKAQEDAQNKDVPENAVMEMKGIMISQKELISPERLVTVTRLARERLR